MLDLGFVQWIPSTEEGRRDRAQAEKFVSVVKKAKVGHGWGHSWECVTGGGCVCGLKEFREALEAIDESS